MHDKTKTKRTKILNKINDLAHFSAFSYITRAHVCARLCAYACTGRQARMQVGGCGGEAEIGEGGGLPIIVKLGLKIFRKFQIYFKITLQQNPEA